MDLVALAMVNREGLLTTMLPQKLTRKYTGASEYQKYWWGQICPPPFRPPDSNRVDIFIKNWWGPYPTILKRSGGPELQSQYTLVVKPSVFCLLYCIVLGRAGLRLLYQYSFIRPRKKCFGLIFYLSFWVQNVIHIFKRKKVSRQN